MRQARERMTGLSGPAFDGARQCFRHVAGLLVSETECSGWRARNRRARRHETESHFQQTEHISDLNGRSRHSWDGPERGHQNVTPAWN